jgi:hypothetical protein
MIIATRRRKVENTPLSCCVTADRHVAELTGNEWSFKERRKNNRKTSDFALCAIIVTCSEQIS